MKTSVKKLPANLNVSVGKKEETHANRFTGEEINLDPMDAAVYKAVMLAELSRFYVCRLLQRRGSKLL